MNNTTFSILLAIIGLFVGFVIAFVFNMIKNKSKAMYMTIIFTALIIGLLIGILNHNSSNMNTSGFENAVLVTNGLAESISDSFILIKPSMNILLNYDNPKGCFNFVVYILESISIYVIFLLIMSKIYLKGAKRNYH